MLFNSVEFLVFFVVVTAAYFLMPFRYRWLLLLAASCYFYMAFIPAYILILLFTIVNDYFAGILIKRSTGKRKKFFLVSSIVANVGVLGFFKYFNFFNTNLAALASRLDWNYPISALAIVLPIGLSFHTFQSLSYTIEVYRGRQASERHFGIFALYVMFYPQLVAGPIERPGNLLHQFREQHDFDYDRVTSGLVLMTWGFFKKVVIADRLAVTVNHIFGNLTSYSGIQLIVTMVFFAFQIYCDFSGYSDIAIGAAQVMGFRLMRNFNRPYFSRSVSEFWSRWHISLSTWFRDYVYIPLGGNRVPKWRWYFNILIVFIVSGLWHGANWTFVAWGAFHGAWMILESWTASLARIVGITLFGKVRLPSVSDRLSTFQTVDARPVLRMLNVGFTFVLVCFAWIFFRAANFSDAFYVITHLHVGVTALLMHLDLQGMKASLSLMGLRPSELVLSVSSVGILLAVEITQTYGSVRQRVALWPVAARWGLYYGLVLSIVFFGVFRGSQFIYFQF